MTTLRTKDGYQKQVYDFIKDVYVVCPACGGKAIIKTPEFALRKTNEQEIKLICTSCGHNKRLQEKPDSVLYSSPNSIIKGKYVVVGGAIDPYFHLPLWLTMNCCDNILWAYNYEHLDFLRSHVEAKLRERNTQEMANKSLGSRLPKWMTSKKNREMILKALMQLKNKT
jgi:DNA-directed RNA polymerase subunit RPC12/RpoP